MNNEVKIVREDKKNLNLLGKTVTHKHFGEGIVVGYSSISGEPFAFFYKNETVDKVICFRHEDIIGEV